jgi:hypothetical protein
LRPPLHLRTIHAAPRAPAPPRAQVSPHARLPFQASAPPAARLAPHVRVTIDRLVLTGFGASQARAIARALEAELGAALAELARSPSEADASGPGGLGPGRNLAALRLPGLRFGASPSGRAIGARAARAIAKGIGT